MPRAVVLALAAALGVAGCAKEDAPPDTEPAPVAAVAPQLDPLTGFAMTGDWQLVRANCTSCHSARLVTQQRGTAQQWLTMIRWMQQKQNLWAFDAATEQKIIAYLAENYPPTDTGRRAALPPRLMPPNPYSTE